MNANDENKRPEEIESELEQTRAQVSSTLDAIQSKLTPGELMDQAIDYWRKSAPADFGSNLSSSVRQNPLPVTLIGVGIAWLMMAGRKSETRYRDARYDAEDDYDYRTSEYGYVGEEQDYSESTLQRARSATGDTAEHLRDKASELSEQARETAQNLRDKTSDITSDMSGRASDAYHSIRGRASEMSNRASGMARGTRDRIASTASNAKARVGDLQQRSRQQYERARSGVSHVIDEQPLVIGAIGVAIGAALGASLPATRREDELMGRRRDDLMHGAKDTAREYVEPMKESAQRVAETAEQELRRATGETTERWEQRGEPASSDDVTGTQAYATGSQQDLDRPGSIV